MTVKKLVRQFFPKTESLIIKILRKEISYGQSVLDLGCGFKSALKHLIEDPSLNLHTVGVDAFSPYLDKNQGVGRSHSEYIESNIFDIEFSPDTFDCAMLFDVIEHFEKEQFYNFLPKLEKIAKKILIITPNGFIEQGEYDDNPYQEHVSGWTVDDLLSHGFECYGLSGLKHLRKEMWEPRIRPAIIGSFLCDISQVFIQNRPRLAYHIVAIKKRH